MCSYCGKTRLFPPGEVWCFDHDIWGRGARHWLLQILRTGSNLRELTWFWMVSFLIAREFGFTSALFRYSTYVSNKNLTESEFSMCEPVVTNAKPQPLTRCQDMQSAHLLIRACDEPASFLLFRLGVLICISRDR